MKKLIISLLSITVILSGCAHEEQPVEPPVVNEENEILPDNNQEDETNNHEQDNLENDKQENSNNEIACLTMSQVQVGAPYYDYVNNFDCRPEKTSGKIDESKEYVYIEEQRGIDLNYLADECPGYSSEINYSTNEYFNWLTSINPNENDSQQKIVINLQGKQIKEINEYISKQYNRNVKDLEITYRVNLKNDVLSISLRLFRIGKYLHYRNFPIPIIFNIDLNTNLLLTNEELLSLYGLNFETTQAIIEKQLHDLGVTACETNETDPENCYINDYLTGPAMKALASKYSYIFIGDDGKLKMLVQFYSEDIAQFNGNVKNVVIIDLED